jgi:hypothetical protein
MKQMSNAYKILPGITERKKSHLGNTDVRIRAKVKLSLCLILMP